MSDIDPNYRSKEALRRRVEAATESTAADFQQQQFSLDEEAPYVFSFTKGLQHTQQGLLQDVADFVAFRNGTESADPAAFGQVPLVQNNDSSGSVTGIGSRQFESPTGGHSYVLQGVDSFATAMPMAPRAGTAELAAELAEVYQMALHRDFPVAAFMDTSLVDEMKTRMGGPADPRSMRLQETNDKAGLSADRLSQLRWFAGAEDDGIEDAFEQRRRFGQTQTPSNMYRGVAPGDQVGPFLSQFMVVGTQSRVSSRVGPIRYGNQQIEQTVRVAFAEKDYMTSWQTWLDVQNAKNTRRINACSEDGSKAEFVSNAGGGLAHRRITQLRDLATYVHDDQLYQAYLNAALLLLSEEKADCSGRFGIDPGIPYHGGTANQPQLAGNREPFAVFGPPHLLTLVTEVASRALRAVRAQKFSVHRRLRPEALAARMHTAYSGYDPSGTGEFGTGPVESGARQAIATTIAKYAFPTDNPQEAVWDALLTEVREHNAAQNTKAGMPDAGHSWLLPMAFPEGSPMHPAYGAGHATVAGACVTMLKAFFAMEDKNGQQVMYVEAGEPAYVPAPVPNGAFDSTQVELIGLTNHGGLSLEGELNKLAWNISNARNIAGVHYHTDYIESILLGENITISILREQMVCYDERENLSFTLPLFVERTLPECIGGEGKNGTTYKKIKIKSDGTLEKLA